MLVNIPAMTASPPDKGIKGLSFLFWSFTTNPILFRNFMNQGVKYMTIRNPTKAPTKGMIFMKKNPIRGYKNISKSV